MTGRASKSEMNARASRALFVMRRHHAEYSIWPDVQQIAKEMELPYACVYRAIKVLERAGMIERAEGKWAGSYRAAAKASPSTVIDHLVNWADASGVPRERIAEAIEAIKRIET